jgi:hypothetical protein
MMWAHHPVPSTTPQGKPSAWLKLSRFEKMPAVGRS